MIKYIRKRYDLIDSNSTECIVLEERYNVDEYWDDSVAPKNYTWLDAKIIISLSDRTIVLDSEDEEEMLNRLRTMMDTVGRWSNEHHWIWQSTHPRSSETVKIASDASHSIASMSIMRSTNGDVSLSFSDSNHIGKICISKGLFSYPHYNLHDNLKTILNNLANALSDIHLTLTNP